MFVLRRKLTSTVLKPGLPFLVLAVIGVIALVLGTARASFPGAANPTSISVDGHAVSEISLDGQLMPVSQYYDSALPGAEAAGKYLHLVLDRSAVARGYFVAYSDLNAAQAYLTAHDLGAINTSTTARVAKADRVSTVGLSSLNGRSISLAACDFVPEVWLFVDVSCGGSELGMVPNDYISNMADYGFNDKISSAEVGYCISNLTIWTNANKGGSTTSLGGGDVYTSMPIGFNDDVSSASTDSSGAC